jgi:hypothetical protein
VQLAFYMLLNVFIYNIQGLCQSRLSTADHALSLVAPATTVVCLTAAKFRPLNISCVGVHLVQCCENLHFRDFVWLLLVACVILFYNYICTEVWKLRTNRKSACALENFQWCGKLCFSFSGCPEQSQSHIATDGQSISKSWFITLWQLRSCFSEAPSLTRGRVCLFICSWPSPA